MVLGQMPSPGVIAYLNSAMSADVSSMGTAIEKSTTLGPITGRVDSEGIERYFGVPVAADTGGTNRWKPPQPLAPWTTPIATTAEKGEPTL